MPQMIHYQDDIFFLSVLVKALDQGLSVQSDPEHFRGQVSAELSFLDESIRTYCGLLTQNSLLIERAQYLKLLERTARSFALVLEKIVGGDYPGSAAYAGQRQTLEAMLSGQHSLFADLDELLSSTVEGVAEIDLVSQDEMSELLKE
jgi:hypothetical protein